MMRGLSILAFGAIVTGSALPAAAQKKTEPSKPKTETPRSETCITTEPGRVECNRVLQRGFGARMDSAMMKRAALGIELRSTGTVRDTLGVFVASVTPKGPAENAGIFEGDRIMSINGVDLRVASGDVEDSYASGLPAHRLQREVTKLAPGARVNLRVYSGGRVRDVQVTAGRAYDLMRSRSMFGYGDGPGNMYIFRDGMGEFPAMPPFPPMAAMPPMPEMAPMPPMPPMEGFERMRMEQLPRMRMELQQQLPKMRRELRERLPQMRMELDQLTPQLKMMNPDAFRMLGNRRTIRI